MTEKNLAIVFVPALQLGNSSLFSLLLAEHELFFEFVSISLSCEEVEPGKYVVYLMKNGEPVEQEVEIGIQDILNAEVKSGLQTGDVVLTNATDFGG